MLIKNRGITIMILDFNKIEEKALANFKGGEKALNAKMNVDENNKSKGKVYEFVIFIDLVGDISQLIKIVVICFVSWIENLIILFTIYLWFQNRNHLQISNLNQQ